MNRTAVLVSLVAAIVVASQPANAKDFFLFARHPKVDHRVATASVATNLGATGVYWAVKDGHHGIDWGAWGATTFGCMVLGPMIAAAFVPERELTTREVLVMEGSCIVPIVGGILVNALFDANPQWEAPPVRAAYRNRVRR